MGVEIQRGTPKGHRIFLENEGDEGRDRKGGHIVFNVQTFDNTDKRRTGFVRDDDNVNDLHYFVKVNLLQALVGYDVNITHLDGHIVNVNNLPNDIGSTQKSKVTAPQSVIREEGEGMPIMETFPTQFGDLYIHFEVVLPSTLSKKQQNGIDSFLFL